MSNALPPCRSCGGDDLKLVLSLGQMPLANALLTAEQLSRPEQTYPLDLAFCPRCSLLQITETVDPNILFREYLYFSSYSDTMLQHSKALADKLVRRENLSGKSLVVEVASNDGYLLQFFKQYGIPVLGIEPAANIAKVAEEKGIPTLCDFFDAETALRLKKKGKGADIILGLNVLAHVADLNSFVEGVRILLKPAGTAIFEFPYAKDMIDKTEFDTIYHEHLCYYSLTAVRNLFTRHNLNITDVERVPVHGGSLRIYAQHQSTGKTEKSVEALLAEEKNWGVGNTAFYMSFTGKVLNQKKETLRVLKQLRGEGKRIVAYGAAAKGTVLLNYYGIGKEYIDFIADKSPYKQNHYLPGSHISIKAPDEIEKTKPDYLLILPWNLKSEIMEQMGYIREWGGRFIILIPKVEII